MTQWPICLSFLLQFNFYSKRKEHIKQKEGTSGEEKTMEASRGGGKTLASGQDEECGPGVSRRAESRKMGIQDQQQQQAGIL